MTLLLIGTILVPLLTVPLLYALAKRLKEKTGYVCFVLLLIPLINNPLRCASRVRVHSRNLPGTIFVVSNWKLRFPGRQPKPSNTLIISLLTALVSLFSVPYMRQRIGDDPGRYGLYYSLYALYSLGMMGTVLATNLIEFYLFFEIMLVPSFFLIAEWGYGEKERISLTYFIWTHVGALVLLVGILVTAYLTSVTDMDLVIGNLTANPGLISTTLRLGIVAAMCFGFFVKIGQFGLHVWLPSAYAEAPTPISTILAAAMTGIGGYATVRIVMTIFPQSFLTFSAFFAGWALITMIYGSAMALVQDDIKRLLAYSSISQMGYILFGLAAFNSFGVSGSMFQYVSNATAKGILFIVVGAVMLQVRGERSLSKMGGLASKMPITATAAFIGSLTLAGLPSTNGFLSEFFLFQGGFVRATDTASEYRFVIAALGIIATALTAGYSLMAMKKIFFGAPNSDTSDVKEAPWTITLPLITLSIVTIILGIYPEPILGRLLSAARAIVGA